MNFRRLPSNSENLLLEIVNSDNPVAILSSRFDGLSHKEDEILRGIIREICQEGYINIKWAGNVPYHVTINNSARTYEEQLEKSELHVMSNLSQGIFISHRSTDKNIADAVFDFFVATGIPREKIFCSSLPGNDIKQKISDEVKDAIKNSCLNIAILSNEYYESAYCLNEAGILWFLNTPVIPIALPEITPDMMIGFLDGDYKIRRLNNVDDIAYVYDTACESSESLRQKAAVVTVESHKLIEKYETILSTRVSEPKEVICKAPEVTTDDERIVLYYLISKQVRKVSKDIISNWLQENEIYHVDIDNAFDLLSTLNDSKIVDGILELSPQLFRKYTSQGDTITKTLLPYLESHIEKGADTFTDMWLKKQIDNYLKLFVAYIVDERIINYGDRWMAKGQIEDIKNWENKYGLDDTLSSNYGSCLTFFVHNKLVFESDWTSEGNVREYSLCNSLKDLFFNDSLEYKNDLEEVKSKYKYDLPF